MSRPIRAAMVFFTCFGIPVISGTICTLLWH